MTPVWGVILSCALLLPAATLAGGAGLFRAQLHGRSRGPEGWPAGPRHPRAFSAPTYCQVLEGRLACLVDCDRGVVRPARGKGGTARLSTRYLRAETSEQLPGQTPAEGGYAAPVTRSIADLDGQGLAIATVFVLAPRDAQECRPENF